MSDHKHAYDTALARAREHVQRPLPYTFSSSEEQFLELFFSNYDRHYFLVSGLPGNVLAALLAMYSRIKNPRGLRGVFLDTLVVYFLASQLETVKTTYNGNVAAFLKEENITSLDVLLAIDAAQREAQRFLSFAAGNPEYVANFAQGNRIKQFLATYLDAYGHTSIARVGSVAVCCEQISILAAKAIEHPRPGAGFIEISRRYVKVPTAALYPFIAEWEGFSYEQDAVHALIDYCSDSYMRGMESFQTFLRGVYPDAADGALFGEACDVVSNLLPAATLTSVGACLSGEALRSLLRCLLLEDLPETTALAEVLHSELAKTGADQFVRHVEPTEWDSTHIGYLPTTVFQGNSFIETRCNEHAVEQGLDFALETAGYGHHGATLRERLEEGGFFLPRGSHDKLPPLFEHAQMSFRGLISFRSWRDFQRHTLSSNERTLLTTKLGFYQHDKPLDPFVAETFQQAQQYVVSAVSGARAIPALFQQYMLPLGYNVGFLHASNLRQLEFLCWQRGGANVNHEVRRVVLEIDSLVGKCFPWWQSLSRTDRTPKYRLAREATGVAIA